MDLRWIVRICRVLLAYVAMDKHTVSGVSRSAAGQTIADALRIEGAGGALFGTVGFASARYSIQAAALAEIAYMLETNLPAPVEQAFLDDLLAGTYQLACADPDLRRIKHLTQKYYDLPLGLTDAVVISCAEMHGGRVLTFDRRRFSVVARTGPALSLLPPLA